MSDQAPMDYSKALLDEMLDQIQKLAISDDQPSIYEQLWESPGQVRIYGPPSSHLVANIDHHVGQFPWPGYTNLRPIIGNIFVNISVLTSAAMVWFAVVVIAFEYLEWSTCYPLLCLTIS